MDSRFNSKSVQMQWKEIDGLHLPHAVPKTWRLTVSSVLDRGQDSTVGSLLDRGRYKTVGSMLDSYLPALKHPHSVFKASVHAGTICLCLES